MLLQGMRWRAGGSCRADALVEDEVTGALGC